MADAYGYGGGGGKVNKKRAKAKAPSFVNPFAGAPVSGPASGAGGVPLGYNPFEGAPVYGPTSGAGAGVYGYTPPVQSLQGGMYAPNTYWTSQMTGGPKVWGYNPGMYGAQGGGGGGGGGSGVGYFPGLFWPNGDPMLSKTTGQQLGGGWGNPALVYGSEGYYQPSWYGERALGLSDLNVNEETGELQGSMNRYGQPLGTQAPSTYFAPRQGGKYYFRARTPAENLWYNRMYGKPGVAIQSLRDKRQKMRGPADQGQQQQQSKSGPIWYNELINWNI